MLGKVASHPSKLLGESCLRGGVGAGGKGVGRERIIIQTPPPLGRGG